MLAELPVKSVLRSYGGLRLIKRQSIKGIYPEVLRKVEPFLVQK